MLPTMTAKKLFRPMPGAMANGRFARKAMTNIPTAEAMQVAMKAPFQRSWPFAPKFVNRFGFRAMM